MNTNYMRLQGVPYSLKLPMHISETKICQNKKTVHCCWLICIPPNINNKIYTNSIIKWVFLRYFHRVESLFYGSASFKICISKAGKEPWLTFTMYLICVSLSIHLHCCLCICYAMQQSSSNDSQNT